MSFKNKEIKIFFYGENLMKFFTYRAVLREKANKILSIERK
jgi:hypothetical protein